MEKGNSKLKLLLIDDEDDFRKATSVTLQRRGFDVTEAADGQAAIKAISLERPDVVLLDLKMPGLSGIETLEQIRKIEPDIPVIILTGHGDFDSAMAGIKLEIVDFIQKPVDIDLLGQRIKALLEKGADKPLREPTIAEIMAPPSLYPRVFIDEPVKSVLRTIHSAYIKPIPGGSRFGQVRSTLVYDRNEKFMGIVRFSDLLKLVIPSYLDDSPYASFFTGMFIAQCKIIGQANISSLINEQIFVDLDAPLMEAVHLLVEHKRINLPVVKDGKLAGVIRGRDIILEIAQIMRI